MANSISVGIDLGTTFSAVAFVNDNEQAEIIVNMSDENSVTLPSVVYYESETSIVVGKPALDEAEVFPDKTVQFVKRFIGEDYTPPASVPQDETPVKVEAKILSAIKKYVEDHENAYEIQNAVITVPAYFNFNKHNLTRQAAEIAELNVLGIINEPMAAAIYYCHNQPVENQKILVYDLGGGTFDSVIIEYHVDGDQKTITTLASDGNHQLGGYDWDKRLEAYLFEKAKEQNPDISVMLSELDPDDRRSLLNAATRLKVALSRLDEKVVSVKIDGTTAKVSVTRKKFEEITRDLLEDTGRKIDSVFNQANISEGDIDLVLLVGGSTFMPMVQEYVRGRFGADKVKLNNPNLAVAYGAAIYAYEMDKYITPPEPISIPTPDTHSPHSEPVYSPEQQTTGDISLRKPKLEIVGQASHSVGVMYHVDGKPYIFNLVFKGDNYTAHEPLIVVDEQGCSNSDGAFTARFFENVRVVRERKSTLECEEADEDYITANSDYLIEVKQLEDVDEYVSLNSADQLTFCGSLYFEDERIRMGDQVQVALCVNENGIKATVVHVPTGLEKQLEFQNKDTLTAEQMEEEQAKNRKVVIALE